MKFRWFTNRVFQKGFCLCTSMRCLWVCPIGIDKIVKQSINDTSAWFERYPDRIHWGTDRVRWFWEEPVSDKFIEISRQYIARLPAEVQEAYAYKNAFHVFGKHLILKQ